MNDKRGEFELQPREIAFVLAGMVGAVVGAIIAASLLGRHFGDYAAALGILGAFVGGVLGSSVVAPVWGVLHPRHARVSR